MRSRNALVFGTTAQEYLDRYETSREIDEVWSTATPKERQWLLVVQYALLRAEMTDSHRPTSDEVTGLIMDMASSRPWMIAARALLFGFMVLVMALVLADSLRSSMPNAGLVRVVIAALMLWVAGLAGLNLSWTLGPRGRAMRLVAASASQDAEVRRRLMGEAIHLDPGKPGKPFRLGV